MTTRGITVLQSTDRIVFRSSLKDDAGDKVTTGTTELRLLRVEDDGTLDVYDWTTNDFVATGSGTPDDETTMTHQTRRDSTGADVATGIWTAVLSTLTNFTAGQVYIAQVTNSAATPESQEYQFQFGDVEGDAFELGQVAAVDGATAYDTAIETNAVTRAANLDTAVQVAVDAITAFVRADVMLATTIDTATTQTSLILSEGLADDYTGNTLLAIITDASDATEKDAIPANYTASSTTLTLSRSPKFTVAATDYVDLKAIGLADLVDAPNATALAAIVDAWEAQSQADPTGFHVNVMEIGGTAQTANDNGADINAILEDTGTTLDGLLRTLLRGCVLHSTTIASLSDQNTITLTSGLSGARSCKGHLAIFTNHSNPLQKSVHHISGYDSGTATLNLDSDSELDPAYTLATGNYVDILPLNFYAIGSALADGAATTMDGVARKSAVAAVSANASTAVTQTTAGAIRTAVGLESANLSWLVQAVVGKNTVTDNLDGTYDIAIRNAADSATLVTIRYTPETGEKVVV